nr:hypothetical protein [Tychonema sp. BBK16]
QSLMLGFVHQYNLWLLIPRKNFDFINTERSQSRVIIVLAFVVKQRYIVIYTSKNNLILFCAKNDKINQFRNEIIEACRPKLSYIPRSLIHLLLK